MSILLIKINNRDILTDINNKFFESREKEEEIKSFIHKIMSDEVEYSDIEIQEKRKFSYYGEEKSVIVINIENFKVKKELKSMKLLNIERDGIENINAEIIEEIFPIYKHYKGYSIKKNIIKNKKERKIEKYNFIFSVIVATLVSFFMFWKINSNYEIFNYFGVWVTIISFIVGGYLFLYRKAKIKNYFGLILFLSGILLSITYSIFANEIFKILNTAIVPILIIFGAKKMVMGKEKVKIGDFFRQIMRAVFINPFYKFKMADGIFKVLNLKIEKDKKVTTDIIKGILISIPVLLILGFILSGATNIQIGGNFLKILLQIIDKGHYIPMIIVWIISYIYLLGMTKSLSISFEKKESAKEKNINTTILNTVLVMINSLYLIFTLIQIADVGQSYSQAARSVFFNLLLVMCINIGIIIKFNKDFKGFTRILFSLMIIFSIGMGINSIINLRAYINAYGLTRLRFLSTTFSVFLIVALILILVGLFKDYDTWKYIIIVGVLIYLGLNYCNMDRIIAKTNIDRIKNGIETKASSIQYLTYGISSDGKYVIRDAIEENTFNKLKIVRQDADYNMIYENLVEENNRDMNSKMKHWFEYNYYND